jgi:hypothetical protein
MSRVGSFKELLEHMIDSKIKIEELPDGERYTATQRWMEKSIKLLLLYVIEEEAKKESEVD